MVVKGGSLSPDQGPVISAQPTHQDHAGGPEAVVRPCGCPDPPASGPCGTQKSTGLAVCPPVPWPGVRCADTTGHV